MFDAKNGCRVRGAENGVHANIPGATSSVPSSQSADRHKNNISILYGKNEATLTPRSVESAPKILRSLAPMRTSGPANMTNVFRT